MNGARLPKNRSSHRSRLRRFYYCQPYFLLLPAALQRSAIMGYIKNQTRYFWDETRVRDLLIQRERKFSTETDSRCESSIRASGQVKKKRASIDES
jgi:hypothetical protein